MIRDTDTDTETASDNVDDDRKNDNDIHYTEPMNDWHKSKEALKTND